MTTRDRIRSLLVLAVIAIVSIAAQSTNAAVLFSDTFDRTDSTDLNASTAGKSGTLGNLTYTARTTESRVVLDIQNNTLRINGPAADGSFGGLVYINDHNFTDAGIVSGRGFSISVDIAAYSTAGSGRQMAVSVGQSLADLDAQTGVGPTDYVADLYVGFRQTTDDLEIYKNGVLDPAETVLNGVPNAATTMRIDYSLSDFDAGSTVDFSVFFDDSATVFTTGSFTWSGTNENYISLSSNLSNDARFDNLEITADIDADPTTPKVDAGGDWITWSGEEVPLAPNVENNDSTALTYKWTHDAPAGYTVDFDPDNTASTPNVTITKDADTDDVTVITITLAVNNEDSLREDVTDTMKIDVYDDACKAAKGKGSVVIDPGDFNADCITDIEDIARMAMEWLVDYTLTSPVVK